LASPLAEESIARLTGRLVQPMNVAPPPVTYRIDGQGKIVHVNAQWDVFARENDGAGALSARVLGQPLNSFLADATVRMLYRKMVAAVRRGRTITFLYRCDAPAIRRLLEMTIRSLGQGEVEFTSTIKELSRRKPVAFFDRQAPRTSEHLRICGWCQRVAVAPGGWIEPEAAAEALGLFVGDAVPEMTHGICEPCRDEMLRGLPPTGQNS
jgi:hypothetical protein